MRTPCKLGKSGSELTAERILIATGGRPYLPEGLPGLELGITSNEAFTCPSCRAALLIVGGGYIALEFANIFSGLGSEVRIVHRGDRMLRGFDDDLRAHMHIEAERAGIQPHDEGHAHEDREGRRRASARRCPPARRWTRTWCCSPSAAIRTPRGSASNAPA